MAKTVSGLAEKLKNLAGRRTHYLVNPKRQIRIGILFGSIGLAGNLFILAILIGFIAKVLPGFVEEGVLPIASRELVERWVLYPLLILHLGILITSFLFSILIGIIFNHRFFGAEMAVLRKIREIRDGNLTRDLVLRETDELKGVANALNELAHKMKDKSP